MIGVEDDSVIIATWNSQMWKCLAKGCQGFGGEQRWMRSMLIICVYGSPCNTFRGIAFFRRLFVISFFFSNMWRYSLNRSEFKIT